MNHIVAVPNWSFCNAELAHEADCLLRRLGVTVHYCKGDVDHQRTVTAFSGSEDVVMSAALELAQLLLPKIDLRVQSGVHPRIGALDVMPFVLLEGDESILIQNCRTWAASFSEEFEVPVHLYEKAALSGKEYRLPNLRGQVGPTSELPDFGTVAHPNWGTTIVGVRNFLLAANINLATPDLSIARMVAKAIREKRESGDPKLVGVRALGFYLPSRNLAQLSLNFTQPDATSFDSVFAFAEGWLQAQGISILETELIGVIRSPDAARATRLSFAPDQVVDFSVTI